MAIVVPINGGRVMVDRPSGNYVEIEDRFSGVLSKRQALNQQAHMANHPRPFVVLKNARKNLFDNLD